MKGKNNTIFSHKSDDWSTPEGLYDILDHEFNFTFDPCPLNSEDNAFFMDWIGSVFINPPYSNISNFLEKALIELGKGNCHTVVFLIPVRSDTKWWHRFIWDHDHHKPRKGVSIRFCNKRLRFGGVKSPAPFPSCIIVMKSDLENPPPHNDDK
jgi:hypothetical protein